MTPPVTAITTTVSSPSAAVRNRASVTFNFATKWNLAVVVVSVVTLILTVNEKPNVPLRVWISVYSMHRAVRVLLEYKKRNPRLLNSNAVVAAIFRYSTISKNILPLFTVVWLLIGYFWIQSSREILLRDAPGLFWLTLAFLALSTLFVGIYVLLHLLYGALWLLHSVLWMLHSVLCLYLIFLLIEKGASDADISILPKYRFESDCGACRMVPMLTNGLEFSAIRVLQETDAQCCICLCNYENGVELYSLPCNHHFHTGCIRQWLKRKASCPLCNREMNR